MEPDLSIGRAMIGNLIIKDDVVCGPIRTAGTVNQ
ncbi:hypothetical protein SIAM614_31186 [Roseibium aggregatum IAM 12614]|uniref:Uncharacterized protein n=1 Tax=Roseibium aggregatum (strain ATCC 25650 / DSM 13394 / JCM 20685 / NBRC 16684 / NCIMB 2208 / IAM 12614 / B1) TaxID=384765 RepID=A0NZE9_ROSAI|nr:hypothetical protein SIAM614_31186 [Roseibium aggregatum IAM 12614]